MRFSLTFLILLIGGATFAQKGVDGEFLSPLGANHVQIEKYRQRETKNVDGIFVYRYDTLEVRVGTQGVRILDDFTTNKFKPHNAQPGDPEVTDTVWFHLYQSGVPDTMGTEYMDDTTYIYEFDTVPGFGFDSIVIDTIPIPWVEVDVYDICNYPPTFVTDTLWPNSSYVDSLWNGTTIDFFLASTDPDFTQDSVIVYKVDTSILDTGYLWIDDFAYLNNTYAIDPPTYGVVSFDGLDEAGKPYDFNTTGSGAVDVLTSVPLNLATKPDGITPWAAADALELSFWYQPAGYGEAPESTDSLIVQFWSPSDAEWSTVWKTFGTALDTFKRGAIPIQSINYLQSGFQFRFRSFGAQNGSLDVWHIDLVNLAPNLVGDTIFEEIAIQEPVNTLLKEYTAMPWHHYKTAPESFMLDTVFLEVYNSDAVTAQNALNAYFSVCESGDSLTARFSDQNSFGIPTRSDSALHIDYDDGTSLFFYDTSRQDTCAFFDVKFRFQGGINIIPSNKEYSFTQRFSNFYAYDDGTAEAAYGVTSTSAQVKLAYLFTVPLEDSLYAVKIHFEPSVNDATTDPFILMVWDNAGPGGTPGNIIYEEPLLMSPKYHNGRNGFYTYELSEKVAVNGSFYVGWKQTTSSRLNVGFDENTNNRNKIYFDVLGGVWQNTSFDGSMMIRPVFDAGKSDAWVNVEEIDLSPAVYPNPVNNQLTVELPETGAYLAQVLDLNGRLIQEELFNQKLQLDFSPYHSGLYILKVSDNLGNFTTVKVIKQ